MTTETILTDEHIKTLTLSMSDHDLMQVIPFARAIEQAVLQSEQVQAWKRDVERLDWLESCEDSHGFCHAGYGDYIYYAHQVPGMPTVREVIDAAMEQKT